MYDVIIIGAGVAGTYIARELARYNLKLLLLDKENDVANQTTMANSAIIHAGYDAKAGYKKGKFNAPGNKMFDQVCDELDVLFKRCGSLVVGFDENDQRIIKELYENGVKNGVPDMRILDKKEVHEMEKNISDAICCALYAPTAGIISPFELAIALAENAVDNGVTLKLNTRVENIYRLEPGYKVVTNNGDFETRLVINCAGVFADEICNMVTKPNFEIKPRKGNYFILDKDMGDMVNHIIFQCPSDKGKGILIAPTVHGNLIVGPDSEFVTDKNDLATESEQLEYVKKTALLTSDKIQFNKVIRVFAGLRASSSTGDFVIEEVEGAKGFINVGGYESPGLSSIPAVAEYVVTIVKNTGLVDWVKNENFNPRRRPVVRFVELSKEEKIEKIKENSKFGQIVCRCETVTEAEIIDCIHRSAGATTVKGVKKRTRPGMGRCQGGFCGPRVQEILARELNKNIEDILYDGENSYVLTEQTK
ncbi:NAD(P)/FAD-dependent oxidoreductase [Anaeromicropila populeti]|uniref:Glycerol-3-phosphate dehydrogenase n=1 Tax=Anaeromicropila populeti TaxID=37658 RepID=A0A1I6I6I7_9FIRM|nr:NAD(P)/FAD-dependent oxidoreductase [Anaeromicropila populeti]SFR62326.1 glycerol-3-phosphate dehydrogenase [Anaeromicropila populeti]